MPCAARWLALLLAVTSCQSLLAPAEERGGFGAGAAGSEGPSPPTARLGGVVGAAGATTTATPTFVVSPSAAGAPPQAPTIEVGAPADDGGVDASGDVDAGTSSVIAAGAAIGDPSLRCPSQPPEVSRCTDEGIRCLYPIDALCYEVWECVFELWSPRIDACELDIDLAQDAPAGCPERFPIDGSPCAPDALECGFETCEQPSINQHEYRASCREGAWFVDYLGCFVRVP